MICVFLGVPGSGKGTQAKKLCSLLHIPYVGTGEILRDNISRGTELGLKVSDILKRGHFVDDETMIALIEEEIKNKNSFVMDGFPRTVSQADAMERLFGKYGKKLSSVLFLDVSVEEVVKRVLGRYLCGKCGKDFNVYLESIKGNICPACGGGLIRRSDDTASTIRARIDEYNKKTAPLKDYYLNKNILKIIDGRGSVEDIFARIPEVLNKRITRQ